MVKITRPLFGDSARGQLKGVGIFRRTPTGHTLQAPYAVDDPNTPAQQEARTRFAVARRAWAALPAGSRSPWPVYWRDWLATEGRALVPLAHDAADVHSGTSWHDGLYRFPFRHDRRARHDGLPWHDGASIPPHAHAARATHAGTVTHDTRSPQLIDHDAAEQHAGTHSHT